MRIGDASGGLQKPENVNCVTCPLPSSGRSGATATPYAVQHDARLRRASRTHTLGEMNVLLDTREQIYELHWMRHAERYIALVRAALDKDPDDEQLLELLQAMEAALAKKLKRPLH